MQLPLTQELALPIPVEFDQEEADRLVAELFDLITKEWLTGNDLVRAAELRAACKERGITAIISSDRAILQTIDYTWNELLGRFFSDDGPKALTIDPKNAEELFHPDGLYE